MPIFRAVEFSDALLQALYSSSNIYQLVTEYVDKLAVAHKNKKAPNTCVNLVLRAQRVYSLLGVPHSVSLEDHVAVVIKRLPAVPADYFTMQ